MPYDFGPRWNFPSSNIQARGAQSLAGRLILEPDNSLLMSNGGLAMTRHAVFRLSDQHVLKFRIPS